MWLVLLSQTVHHPWYERILDESSELRNGPVRGNKISGWDVKVVSSLQVQALAIVYQMGAGLLFFRAEPTHPMWCFVNQALVASGEVVACDELHKPGEDVPWLLYEFSGLFGVSGRQEYPGLPTILSVVPSSGPGFPEFFVNLGFHRRVTEGYEGFTPKSLHFGALFGQQVSGLVTRVSHMGFDPAYGDFPAGAEFVYSSL